MFCSIIVLIIEGNNSVLITQFVMLDRIFELPSYSTVSWWWGVNSPKMEVEL